MRQKQHTVVVTDNGVYFEVRLLLSRQLYTKLKFYESKTHRPIEDLIIEIIKGCIDEVEVL
jgi:hypothetical protein